MQGKKLLAVWVVVVVANVAPAADGEWERFVDGSLGQATEFSGAVGLVIIVLLGLGFSNTV